VILFRDYLLLYHEDSLPHTSALYGDRDARATSYVANRSAYLDRTIPRGFAHDRTPILRAVPCSGVSVLRQHTLNGAAADMCRAIGTLTGICLTIFYQWQVGKQNHR